MSSDPDSKELKRRLKKSLDYKNLTDTISKLISNQAKQDFNFVKKTLPLLKQLLNDLVDSSFTYIRQIMETTLPKPMKHIRHITSVPKFNLKKSTQNQLTCSSELIMNESKLREDQPIVSEFSHVKGPARFGKSIREIDRVRAPSPGPSCYYYDPMKNKIRSPRIIFPKSAAVRNSYIPESLSPGPSKYYSSIRYLAKHN